MSSATANPQPLHGEPAAGVLVAGASGYAGALAAQLVWRHPHLELKQITARTDAGARLDDLHPRYRVPLTLTELDLDALDGVGAAIVAYPHGAAAPVVRSLREQGIKVVDLSADFRLQDLATYERWYGEHAAPELIAEAVYGLPELNRERIAAAELVANPGCYPTASILALAPVASRRTITDLVIDAKSGVSGAGRSGGEATQFVSIGENSVPYGVAGHRHTPEIAQELSALGGGQDLGPALTFVPHLLPVDQGELISAYVRTDQPLSVDQLAAAYADAYDHEPFIEVRDTPPGIRDVRDTNRCRIHVATDQGTGRTMVFAAIDNLWKGASSQAIQNLNLMLGLPEGEGIS